MNCEWMERVAFALDGEWTPDIEAHVAACAECRELLADRELLRVAPEIAPEVFAAVRARVLLDVRPSYSTWWQLAAAVALAVGGIAWWALRVPEAERLEIAIAAPAAPVVERVRSTAPSRSRLGTGRVPREKPDAVRLAMAIREELDPAPPRMEGDVAVAMQTEDPDVFILLVGGDDDE
jgi:hypothetical protein